MNMKKVLATCSALLLLATIGTANAAVILSLQPTSQTATPGDVVSLDLVISGLTAGSADSLGDFDVDIGYDTGAMSLVGFSLGSSLGDIGAFEALDFSLGDIGGGIVNVTEVSLLSVSDLDALQADSFALATFDFMVDILPVGSSTLVDIGTVNALGDGFGLPLNLMSTSGAVIRNPRLTVPAPPTLVLIVMGLALIYRRRAV